MTPSDDKRYDRREVDLILQTAAQIDQSRPAPETSEREDLTLAEIQQIGSQAGIDSNAIAAATLGVAMDSAQQAGRRLYHVHVIDGELRGDAWDHLSDHLRSSASGVIVSRSTSALEIEIDKRNGELGKLLVSVRSANGATTVSIWSDAPRLSTGEKLTFGLLGIPVALFPVVASSGGQWPNVGVTAALAVIGVAVGSGATAVWQRWATARWQKRVTVLLESIVEKSTELLNDRTP